MTPRLILVSSIGLLLAGCDFQGKDAAARSAAEAESQRQAAEANEKIRSLQARLDEADRLKAAEKEAEYARVKAELEKARQEQAEAQEKIRQLEAAAGAPRPEPAQARPAPAPVAEAAEDGEEDPVYVGRVVPETQRVASVNVFYEPLDAYGDWVETDDYGYVFRPHLAVRDGGWRPYTDGHWVYTEHGWAWDSNEDFGWATYHYGRWARLDGHGWVWVPGREWAPAWVSWRRGDDYCGWAPLPPESRTRVSFSATVDLDYGLGPAAYVFVSLGNFGARSYRPVIEPPVRNTVIVNKTVNITNITYNTTNNQTLVYNGGPRYDLIKARSQQPVERTKLEFAAAGSRPNRGKGANRRQGDAVEVLAPPAGSVAGGAPARVKEKVGKVAVDKGWQDVPPEQSEKLKKEMAATSLPRKKKAGNGVETPAASVQEPAAPEAVKPGKTPQSKPEPKTEAKPEVLSKPEPGSVEPRRPVPPAETPERAKPREKTTPSAEKPPGVERPEVKRARPERPEMPVEPQDKPKAGERPAAVRTPGQEVQTLPEAPKVERPGKGSVPQGPVSLPEERPNRKGGQGSGEGRGNGNVQPPAFRQLPPEQERPNGGQGRGEGRGEGRGAAKEADGQRPTRNPQVQLPSPSGTIPAGAPVETTPPKKKKKDNQGGQ